MSRTILTKLNNLNYSDLYVGAVYDYIRNGIMPLAFDSNQRYNLKKHYKDFKIVDAIKALPQMKNVIRPISIALMYFCGSGPILIPETSASRLMANPKSNKGINFHMTGLISFLKLSLYFTSKFTLLSKFCYSFLIH